MEIIPRLLAKFNSGKICADFLVGWLVSLELEFLGESLNNEDHQIDQESSSEKKVDQMKISKDHKDHIHYTI